jgi:hypothetical protein
MIPKGKGKVTQYLIKHTEDVLGNGSIVSCTVNLKIRWRMVRFMTWFLDAGSKNHDAYWVKGSEGIGVILGAVEKQEVSFSCRKLYCGSSTV